MNIWTRCKKCSLPFLDHYLENGICRTCRDKIQPEAIAIMEFRPLSPLLEAYEKEMSE